MRAAPAPGSVLAERCSGVLFHPTSLAGRGIGEIGGAALGWVDWLAGAGQRIWQILPLVPTSRGGSPYDGLSAFATNPWLLDPDTLVADGVLGADEVGCADLPADLVDYAAVAEWKETLLRRAFAAFRERADPEQRAELGAYRERNAAWLDDYALFRALRDHFDGASWDRWDPGVRRREGAALRDARARLGDEVERRAWEQWVFDRQWTRLRAHADRAGIRILGDVPIFVAHDSADVWAHPELFRLDAEGRPEVVSGVPPDYFSETGQRWGNPLYDWDAMERDGYRWWTERFRRTLEHVHAVRVDHFRGFEAAWEIPAEEETAVRGTWRPGPGRALFEAVRKELGELPLVAEDLGLITPGVEALRDDLGLPGMRVLQFGWDGSPDNPHHPGNYVPNVVAYTGTHDNDTSLGWLLGGASAEERMRLRAALPPSEPEHWAMIRLVLESPARWAIVPAQDLLGLASEARMNTPGVAAGNWAWRLPDGLPDAGVAARLRELTVSTDRAASRPPPPRSPA